MLIEILKDFQKAIEKLEKVLKLKKTEINRDSAIKRFELCFDLAWKSMKELAKKEGIECYSPRECLRTSFQLKIIDPNKKWFEMLDNRNLTVHLYKEEMADRIYLKLPVYLEILKDLLNKIKQKE